MHIYTYTYRIHIDAIIKTGKEFFKKIYLSLYLKGLCVWEGVGDRTELQHIDPPLLWPSALCLSHSPGLLNRRPGGPLRWVQFFLPHLVSNSSDLQLIDFQATPSYIIVSSPIQSLEWHVWSSSSGNNCHAVHRSLSSGASLYDSNAGFYFSHIVSQGRLRDFFP